MSTQASAHSEGWKSTAEYSAEIRLSRLGDKTVGRPRFFCAGVKLRASEGFFSSVTGDPADNETNLVPSPVRRPSNSLPQAPTGDAVPVLALDEEMTLLQGVVSPASSLVVSMGAGGGLLMPAEEELEEEKRLARCLRSF
jgi:hypothetical protein